MIDYSTTTSSKKKNYLKRKRETSLVLVDDVIRERDGNPLWVDTEDVDDHNEQHHPATAS